MSVPVSIGQFRFERTDKLYAVRDAIERVLDRWIDSLSPEQQRIERVMLAHANAEIARRRVSSC